PAFAASLAPPGAGRSPAVAARVVVHGALGGGLSGPCLGTSPIHSLPSGRDRPGFADSLGAVRCVRVWPQERGLRAAGPIEGPAGPGRSDPLRGSARPTQPGDP